MSWTVALTCNQCGEGGTVIGKVENVVAGRLPRDGEQGTFNVTNIMRAHEVEAHGGKS